MGTARFVALIVGLMSAGLALGASAAPAAVPSSLPSAIQQTCLPNNTVRVTFAWIPSFGGPQWIDLSLADNGFAPGTYVGVGPLSSGTGSFAWEGLAPGRLHYARVNTRSSIWESSTKSTFVTKHCGVASAALVAPVTAERCDAATISWAPANPTGVVQWLDLSTANNGFAAGTFVSSGPHAGDRSSFFWTGLRPGTRHYWRVNTWNGSAWLSSATGSFVTPCAAPTPVGGGGGCHPSYVGACLRIGSGDYDCAGGSGNGPNYTGSVRVVGPDVFDLDRDNDGLGCE